MRLKDFQEGIKTEVHFENTKKADLTLATVASRPIIRMMLWILTASGQNVQGRRLKEFDCRFEDTKLAAITTW
ncbi:hypothetical protein ES319_A08G149500v1 [Gossypium barbadense]|uniref:Uncharacterized protein n=2 Tax=Gossypium TaxID=3633 RepID=A0A5J5USG1_GOSBA|nr:hypothetical protein ES319_A08G149500v1 [Gossypium barbadense]TYH06561.1 hypothetical protein ES288_A08G164100v1 [Gossypium darwinii]